MSTAIRTALADDLVSLLSDGTQLDIDGFGRFAVRSYSTPGVAKVPYLSAAKELRAWLEDANGERPPFRCATLVARTADRLGSTEADVAQALDEWLGAIVARLRSSSGQTHALAVEPMWRLGLLKLHWKSARVGAAIASSGPARATVGFVASRALRAAVNHEPAPPIIDGRLVAEICASYPPGGFTTAEQLAAPLARLHQARRALPPGNAIEATLKQPLPPLLKTLLAHTDPDAGRGVRGPLNVMLHSSVGAVLAARNEHRAFMDELGVEAGVPFAVEANGDSWCFCAHDSGTDDRWVFLAGPDAPSRHTHELRFAQWLAVALLVAEIDRVAGDGILAESDLVEIVDYWRAVAPGAETLLSDLPY